MEEIPAAVAVISASNQLSTEDELVIEEDENDQQQPDWSLRYETSADDRQEEGTDGANNPVSTRDLIYWVFQIARGMDYLASKKVPEDSLNSFITRSSFII